TNKKVLAAEPPPPTVHDRSVPEPLAAVAMRALAHDPATRWADGAAVAGALVEAWQRTVTSGAVTLASFASSAAEIAVEPVPRPRPTVDEGPPRGSAPRSAGPGGAPGVATPTPEVARTKPMRAAKPPGPIRPQQSTDRGDEAQVIRTTPEVTPPPPRVRRRRA